MRFNSVIVVAVATSMPLAATSQVKAVALPAAQVKSIAGTIYLVAPYGAIQSSAIWKKPTWTKSGDKPIPVCWERLAESDAMLRAAVRDAVSKTWGFYGMVSFPGWDECKSDSMGIRIGVNPASSGTDLLGRHLDGVKNGVQLRMDFTEFPECASRNSFCVAATAVHEFGHALGMTHEQNRPDSPKWCQSRHLVSGTLPDKTITIWDAQSIMNYCNKDWMDVKLSPLDIFTVTELYGARA